MDQHAERAWMPADWMDECIPALLQSPDDFIQQDGSGWVLLPRDPHDRKETGWRTPVQPGQVVRFFWREMFGDVTITVAEDGSWTSADTWPDRATHFWRDHETIADTMDEAVAGYDDDPLPPGEHEITVGFWSDAEPFRFEIGEDGKPCFVPCAGEH